MGDEQSIYKRNTNKTKTLELSNEECKKRGKVEANDVKKKKLQK